MAVIYDNPFAMETNGKYGPLVWRLYDIPNDQCLNSKRLYSVFSSVIKEIKIRHILGHIIAEMMMSLLQI